MFELVYGAIVVQVRLFPPKTFSSNVTPVHCSYIHTFEVWSVYILKHASIHNHNSGNYISLA